MELVITGCAGLSASHTIYQNVETRKKLLDRYPKSFFTVLGEISQLKEVPEAGIADREEATEGGVFGAMWRLLKRNRLGADFDQRKIPVLQQTIEICETFGLDPYRMESEGCQVWLCTDPSNLLRACEESHVPVAVVGYSTKGPAIRRLDGAAVAYLRRPERENIPEKTNE